MRMNKSDILKQKSIGLARKPIHDIFGLCSVFRSDAVLIFTTTQFYGLAEFQSGIEVG